MIEIEYKSKLNDEIYEMIDLEFNKYAEENEVTCNYEEFNFIAKENNKIIGVITGHSYYNEVHISDLIVLKEYRKNHVGSSLVREVEEYFKNKEFENINLTTYGFQAAEFYKKCGYTLEYIRNNKKNPKLSKYFFIKYL